MPMAPAQSRPLRPGRSSNTPNINTNSNTPNINGANIGEIGGAVRLVPGIAGLPTAIDVHIPQGGTLEDALNLLRVAMGNETRWRNFAQVSESLPSFSL